jgi:hypothetical protein
MKNHTSICKGVARYAHVLAAILTLALTGCGEHGFDEWLFGDSSSSEETGVVSSSSGVGNGGGQAIVEPLLQTKWNQSSPYNDLYPVSSDGKRAPANCVIIATAQIMKYYNHPARGMGQSEPFTYQGYNYPSVNLNAAYDWDNMLDKYTSSATEQQRNAISTFVYHVRTGMGAKSRPIGITTNFGYDKSLQLLFRKYYSDAEWERIIREQLDAGLPVEYSASKEGSDNHAFVIDGYDNTGKFHINWGWGGKDDGYYFINSMNGWDYNGHGDIIINMKPDEGGAPAPYEMAIDKFTASKATVPQNELFTVTAELRNVAALDTFPGGSVGTALVNSSGNIAAIIGSVNAGSLKFNSSRTSTISGFVPGTVNPGAYKLRIVVKHTGGDWKIAERSAIGDGIPNSINLTVTAGEAKGGGYGLSLEEFKPEKTSVPQNGTFNVALKTRNVGLDAFGGGQLGVALIDNSGDIVEVVKTATWNSLNPNATRTGTLSNCTVSAAVPPGQYKLRIVIKPTGEEWRVATMSLPDVPSSIGFRVE